MTDSSKATIERLTNTRWFSHVGQTTSDEAVAQVKSWEEALQDDGTDRWGNVRLTAANALRSSVRAAEEGRYRLWNKLAAEIRPMIVAMATDKVGKVVSEPRLQAIISDLAQWDLLYFLMVVEYGDVVPHQGFYNQLGSWYLSGHFPCDWRGQYPEGQLVIY
jgi:hypothetical protein